MKVRGKNGPTEIESWEDRSGMFETDKDHVFGYVYFSDGSRVGFALNVQGEPDVWEPNTNGGGQFKSVTRAQLQETVRYLREQGLVVRDVV